jgi:carboxyl-terminal processing protease
MTTVKTLFNKINGFTVLFALLTFLLGWQLGHKDVNLQWHGYLPNLKVESKEPPKNVSVDFKLFWDTWDLLSKEYLDKKMIDPNKMYYGAIQGMVAAVGDPYTVFLPPEQQKATKEDLGGSFTGVGMELGYNKDKRLVVMAPLDDSPAIKAGIKAGDLIVKIDSKDTTNLTLPDAVKLIRGPKMTDVNLTIYRDGDEQTRDFKLTRDTIVVKSVKLTFENTPSNKKVGVIKVTRFGERTEEEWDQAVSDILTQGAQAVILDVRNNPGGFLNGAVYIGSEFLEGGDIVFQENAQGEKTPYKVNRQGKLLKLPMAVLVNKGSASASEIVSGALQDRKRAKLVGTKTFGKGTVQTTIDLPNDTGLHITVAKWLTPNGRWANATEGFEPDVLVELPKSTPAPSDATPEPSPSASSQQNDVQLQKALEILN